MELAMKKGEWFSFYAKYFQTVEINSTFYRPPGELQVKSWIKKTKDLEGFESQLVTYKTFMEVDLVKDVFWATSFEKTCVKPLVEADLLGGVPLQLSPYFKNRGSALAILKGVLDAVSPEEYNYAVKFRHRSWLDESRSEINPTTLEVLKEKNVANVLIDGSRLHVSTEQTAAHAYVRLHGRNYDIWYK